MITEFALSTIIVGILGGILIFQCKSGKKNLEEKLNAEIERLKQLYSEERVTHNEEIEKFRNDFENIKEEYSSKKR